MDFEKSSFVKLIGDNHGDLDPLKRATELLLKTIVKKKFYKGDLKIFEKFKIRKIIEDLEVDKEGNEEKAAKTLPPYSRLRLKQSFWFRKFLSSTLSHLIEVELFGKNFQNSVEIQSGPKSFCDRFV